MYFRSMIATERPKKNKKQTGARKIWREGERYRKRRIRIKNKKRHA